MAGGGPLERVSTIVERRASCWAHGLCLQCGTEQCSIDAPSAGRWKSRRWHFSSPSFAHSTGKHSWWYSVIVKGWRSAYEIITSHIRREQAEAGSQQVSEHALSKDNEYLSACVRQHFSCACWISPAKKTAFCNCDHVEWAVVWVWMVVRLIGRDIEHISKWYRRNGLPWASSSTYLGLPRRAASSL